MGTKRIMAHPSEGSSLPFRSCGVRARWIREPGPRLRGSAEVGDGKAYTPSPVRRLIKKIVATARVLKNVISVEIGATEWTAVPTPTWKGRIAGALSALFTTHYTIYPAGKERKEGEGIASVSYYPVKDEIMIQVEEHKWRTVSNLFGPSKITYDGVEYALHEKITGRFSMLRGTEVVVEGRARFRSIQVDRYPHELEAFVAYLAVGLLIRVLFGELGV